ncbi:MAG: DoxX family protein [Acidobacteria bacterium]|nr:DoxX family protein [Acidobacteriota bacterium]
MATDAAPSKGLKITVIILRTLMGLLFLFSAAYYFLKLPVPPLPPGDLKTFNDGLMAAHYLLPVVKGLELVCGLAFVSGRFVPLASLLIAPIIVNILCIAIFLAHETLILALFLAVVNALVAYYHRATYAPLFKAK